MIIMQRPGDGGRSVLLSSFVTNSKCTAFSFNSCGHKIAWASEQNSFS